MALSNPSVDYVAERLKLRSIYVNAHPKQRLVVIRQRLAQPEIGATKLVTVVSAVEALARSLVVHSSAKSQADIDRIYSKIRSRAPEALVQDVLNAFQKGGTEGHFHEDTWPLFCEAVNFRNQVVHECTCLGQDKYPSLIAAALEVLEELVSIGALNDR